MAAAGTRAGLVLADLRRDTGAQRVNLKTERRRPGSCIDRFRASRGDSACVTGAVTGGVTGAAGPAVMHFLTRYVRVCACISETKTCPLT